MPHKVRKAVSQWLNEYRAARHPPRNARQSPPPSSDPFWAPGTWTGGTEPMPTGPSAPIARATAPDAPRVAKTPIERIVDAYAMPQHCREVLRRECACLEIEFCRLLAPAAAESFRRELMAWREHAYASAVDNATTHLRLDLRAHLSPAAVSHMAAFAETEAGKTLLGQVPLIIDELHEREDLSSTRQGWSAEAAYRELDVLLSLFDPPAAARLRVLPHGRFIAVAHADKLDAFARIAQHLRSEAGKAWLQEAQQMMVRGLPIGAALEIRRVRHDLYAQASQAGFDYLHEVGGTSVGPADVLPTVFDSNADGSLRLREPHEVLPLAILDELPLDQLP